MEAIHQKNKINVITLGCSKNLVDTELLMGHLKANNIPVVHQSQKNDFNIVIINTCGFIDKAKEQSINTILQYVDAKKQGLIEKVYVMGCLSQRYKNILEKEIPEVDKFFGVNDLKDILNELHADYKKENFTRRLLTTPKHYAYLKIAEGCSRRCSYCAIPLIRGKHISRPLEQIINEAKNLVKKGVKEILLISQDLSYYGIDIYKKQKLSYLVGKLSDIENLQWIRLHYIYPTAFPMDLLKLMKQRPNICNYIDIPLQHISDKILKSMQRGITKKQTYNLIEKIRYEIPEAAIRTTFIVGYPDETEKDFEELKQFVRESEFERLGVFMYSHEENTEAYKLKDNVPKKVKKQRADEIMQMQQEISIKHNKNMIGKKYKILFDRKEGGYYVGRTEFDSPEVDNEVLVSELDNKIRIGEFENIMIKYADAYDLMGDKI